jgi:hypothetical protein
MRYLPRNILLGAFICASSLHSISQQVIEDISLDRTVQTPAERGFDSPLTKLVNKPGVADAYPFLSGDGLRLYFTSNREGGHGRFFISTRKNTTEPFGEPVVLSKNLTDGYYAGSLSADELTLCMVKSGKIYISYRPNLSTEFGAPVLVKGISEKFHFGPAISPDGKEILVMTGTAADKRVRMYQRTAGETRGEKFVDQGELPIPAGATPGPGQFSKDGLSYYFSFENEKNEVRIWRYTRTSITGRFVDLEELPVQINALKRNFQPSVNEDASIIVHTTSQNNAWDEDDIVLVNDPSKALTAPEQFASIVKNDANNLTVKSKVSATQVKTFPNPFQSDVILEMSDLPSDGTIFNLYDLTGKIIRQQRIVNLRTNIQLGNLPAATYIYQLVDGKGKLVSSGKLVKG